MKRRVLLASLALLVSSAAFGCAATVESESAEPADTEAATVEKEKPSLGEFLDADTKTGEYTVFTEWFEGDTLELTGRFWVDGRRFRYDIYDDGALVRSVISPDGETAYFCFHEDEVCEPSVASVDYYLMRYSMPADAGVEDGTDEETGARRVLYPVRKTDDMPGSGNPWYSEDVTYLVLDDEVIGVITRGASPAEDGSIDGLDKNRELWSNVRTGVAIPADTFELPYPIREAD